MTPRGAQDDQKSDPEAQDDTKTSPPGPRRSKGGGTPGLVSPYGRHLGTENETQTDPKTIEKRSDQSKAKKHDPRRSRTPLGALLATFRGPCGSEKPSTTLEHVVFREK